MGWKRRRERWRKLPTPSEHGLGFGVHWGRYQVEELVGARGFEPPTPWSRTRCSTRLSHAPTLRTRVNALVYLGMERRGKDRYRLPLNRRSHDWSSSRALYAVKSNWRGGIEM